jgi:hypothetical protein
MGPNQTQAPGVLQCQISDVLRKPRDAAVTPSSNAKGFIECREKAALQNERDGSKLLAPWSSACVHLTMFN